MANLELPVDSFLKQFKLFEVSDRLLKEYASEHVFGELTKTLQKNISETMFPEFLELASMTDNFKGWNEDNWDNFVINMRYAYVNKGVASAIDCMMAAVGVKLKSKSFAGFDNSEPRQWKVVIDIDSLPTPDLSTFYKYTKILVKKLLWVRDPKNVNIETNTVDVKIEIVRETKRVIYSSDCLWFEPETSIHRRK